MVDCSCDAVPWVEPGHCAVDASDPTLYTSSMERSSNFAKMIGASMTAEQAKAVREMRVHQELTWRGVADEFTERFPDADYARGLAGNQILGMALCEAAALKLGEDPNAEPWN